MNYAIIGCGRIAPHHIKAALANHFTIVGVCDLLPEKMGELLRMYDLQNRGIPQYTDYKEMVEKEKPSLVSVATESGSHAEIALYCIERGIHVIIEKPIAMSIADADKIITLSKEKKVKVAACHQNRFNLSVLKTKDAMEKGRFGTLSHGSVHIRWRREKDYYDQADWRGKWASDGGALMNQCIHGIDLLRHFMGDIDEVYGVTRNRFHPYIECEDIGMAVLRFQSGAVGTIEGTVNSFPKDLEETLYLFGESGMVKLGGMAANTIEEWHFRDETEKDSENNGFMEKAANVYGNGHTAVFADMQDAIKENREPYITAEDGRKALEIILAIYKSSYTGKPVKLPLCDTASTDFIGFFDKK